MSSKHMTGFMPTSEPTRTLTKSVTCPYNEITDPGAYYCQQTGWLYRVPTEAIAPGHSPVSTVVSAQECFVTKISNDPWIPLNKAREICSNYDFAVNF